MMEYVQTLRNNRVQAPLSFRTVKGAWPLQFMKGLLNPTWYSSRPSPLAARAEHALPVARPNRYHATLAVAMQLRTSWGLQQMIFM